MENGSRIVEATLSNIYVIANDRASRAKRVGLRSGQFNATRKYCSRQKKISTVLALDFTCSFHVTFDDLTRRQKNSRSYCEKCMEILVALNFTCSFTWLLITFVIIIDKPSKFGLCSLSSLDWEQSLFFFRFTEGSERERERRATKPREARNEGGCLSNLASLVRRVVICVSRTVCSTDQERRQTARSLCPACSQTLYFLFKVRRALRKVLFRREPIMGSWAPGSWFRTLRKK